MGAELNPVLSAWESIPATLDIAANPASPKPARTKPNKDSLVKALAQVAATTGTVTRGKRAFPHPFPARMPIDVALAAVQAFSLKGDRVLDPMSGSGIVTHAAQRLGRLGIGRDVDPLAVLISKVFCSSPNLENWPNFSFEILARARSLASDPNFRKSKLKLLPKEDQQFIAYWFDPKVSAQLFALADAILSTNVTELSLLSSVVLSSLIIAKSSGVSRALDLARSRPHRVDGRPKKYPFDIWSNRSAQFTRSFESRADSLNTADIQLGDARVLELESNSVDAVITSPPYLNAIDYIRASKFSLVFLGAQLEALRKIRSESIGTEVGLRTGILPKELEKLVDGSVADLSRRPMIRHYLADMLKALQETQRVLKPGSPAMYILGPSILSRRDYDADEVFSRLARLCNFEVIGVARRDLSSANRSLPPPKRNARGDAINRRMTCEIFILLRKGAN